jgi:hypothetical protein
MNVNLQVCLRFFVILILSTASYIYLDNESDLLQKSQKLDYTQNTTSTKLGVIENKSTKESEPITKAYNKKLLPDIRLMELILSKLKEGVPTLKPRDL